MDKLTRQIDKIVNEIYDKDIENHIEEYVYIAIKEFIRQGVIQGIKLGKEKLSHKIIAICEKEKNPNADIIINYRNNM